MPKLSLVIAVYNEEENIHPLENRVRESLQGWDYELIFIDDGSTDGTHQKIRSIHDDRVKVIRFKKNYGQSPALSAGFEHATGEFIVTLDGDLQNDPADIPMMVKLAEEGDWDVVTGIRKNRKDGFILRKLPSWIANRIFRRIVGVKIRDNGCALKVFRNDVAKSLGLYGELHRFIAILAALEGATITQVEVSHRPRIHGRSKYNLSRTSRVISDLILLAFLKRYLQKPMHFFGKWGLLIFAAGLFINLYLLALKILSHDIWGRPLLILGVLLVIAGFQMITTGIVAEIMMRVYYESQDKKPYRIRDIHRGKTSSQNIEH
jgi:glycosyltransferase involved in cell wall biosynthesis